jgi:hypothetical protein
VDASGAQFALPNAAHRDKCIELAPQVEGALSAHFDMPVRLVLVVEGGQEGASMSRPSTSGASTSGGMAPYNGGNGPAAPAEIELEDEDPEELQSAPTVEDHQSAAVDRLLEAFPGTSEIDE